MPLNLYTKQEDDLIKSKYREVGTKLAIELGRSKHSLVNRASILGIKFNIIKIKRYCKSCGKELVAWNNLNKKYYSLNTKTGLCKNCSASRVYKNRGVFTHNHGRLWTKEEIEFLINNFYDITSKELESNLKRNFSSIQHKAYRLKLKRNPKFLEEGNSKGRDYFKNNNPMLNPKYKFKALQNQVHIFSRIKMTSIESKVAKFLNALGIKYEFNKCLHTSKTFRFPDFTIGKLVIECDGTYWHKDRKQQDSERQIEIEELGYKVIRFSEESILNNFEEVKKCLLLALSQSVQ